MADFLNISVPLAASTAGNNIDFLKAHFNLIRKLGGLVDGKWTFLACSAPFLTDPFSGRRCVGSVSEAMSN